MKLLQKKILLFSLALPIFSIISILITIQVISENNTVIIGSVFFVHLILIFFADKNNLISFNRKSFPLMETYYSFLFVFILLFIFYLERLYFNIETKYPYPFFFALLTVLFQPIAEEIFIKKIIIDNLIQINYTPIIVFIISVLYFVFLHLPNIHITHFFLVWLPLIYILKIKIFFKLF